MQNDHANRWVTIIKYVQYYISKLLAHTCGYHKYWYNNRNKCRHSKIHKAACCPNLPEIFTTSTMFHKATSQSKTAVTVIISLRYRPNSLCPIKQYRSSPLCANTYLGILFILKTQGMVGKGAVPHRKWAVSQPHVANWPWPLSITRKLTSYSWSWI